MGYETMDKAIYEKLSPETPSNPEVWQIVTRHPDFETTEEVVYNPENVTIHTITVDYGADFDCVPDDLATLEEWASNLRWRSHSAPQIVRERIERIIAELELDARLR